MLIEIYTDGASENNGKINSVGGFGWLICVDGRVELLYGGKEPGATNQSMELYAALDALNSAELEEIIDNNCQIKIYTDSAYLCNCYKDKWYRNWQSNGWLNSKKEPVANRLLWEELIPHFENPNIEFIKVKGHSSNIGNQYADKIAVAARTMGAFKFSTWLDSLLLQLKGDTL